MTLLRSLLTTILLGHLVSAAAAQRTAPGRVWPTGSPAPAGPNAAVLDSIDAEIKAGRYGYVDRMLADSPRPRCLRTPAHAHDYYKATETRPGVTDGLNANDPTSPYNYYSACAAPHLVARRPDTLQSVTRGHLGDHPAPP